MLVPKSFPVRAAMIAVSLTLFDCVNASGTVYNIPPDPAPTVLGSGDVLNLGLGGSIGNSTAEIRFLQRQLGSGVQAGSTINVNGGSLGVALSGIGPRTVPGVIVNLNAGIIGGNGAEVDGAVWNIYGGTVGRGLLVNAGGVLNVHDGFVESAFAYDGGTVNLSGGAVEASAFRISGTEFNMSGGAIKAYDPVGPLLYPFVFVGGSTWNLSGGMVMTPVQAAVDGVPSHGAATVNILAHSALMGGSPIAGLVPGVPFVIADRDTTLSGVLADGNAFSFDLNSANQGSMEDFFPTTATVTVTLVPEPSSAALVSMLLASIACRVRRRGGA